MGKKARVKNTFSEEDLEFIESKKNVGSGKYDKDYKNVEKALDYKINITFKNQKQKDFYNAIKDEKTQIIFIQGEAGCGKSLVTIAAALDLISKSSNSYNNITIVALIVQNDENLGLLPGSIYDKTFPHLECHYENAIKVLNLSKNNNSREILTSLQNKGIIEGRPVSFLRSWTFSDRIVICEEAQNMRISAVKTVLTRIGENCKIIFAGDISQIDVKELKAKGAKCGLEYAIDKLGDGTLEEVKVIRFGREDIVRNPLISKILDRWD